MLKGIIALTLILLLVTSSTGQTPQTAQDYLKSGVAHFQSGETDAALADAEKALELNANYVDALYLRAALRNKKGDAPGVLADYNKIIELAPSALGVEVVYHNRSVIRLQSKDVDGALDDLNKAVSINPRVAEIYNGRAIARLQKGDLEGALADYEKAIELKPSLPSALLGRGYFRYQKRDFDRALADLSKADSDQGNFSSSFVELNQFIAKNPSDARAYEMRGIFRLLQRKEPGAAKDFKKSLELEPSLEPEIDRITEELRHVIKPK